MAEVTRRLLVVEVNEFQEHELRKALSWIPNYGEANIPIHELPSSEELGRVAIDADYTTDVSIYSWKRAEIIGEAIIERITKGQK